MIDPSSYPYYLPSEPTGHEMRDILYTRMMFNIVTSNTDDMQTTMDIARTKNIADLLDKGTLITAIYYADPTSVDFILNNGVSFSKTELKALMVSMPDAIEKCRDVLTKHKLPPIFDEEELQNVSPVHIVQNITHLKNAHHTLSHRTSEVLNFAQNIDEDFTGIENFHFIKSIMEEDFDTAKQLVIFCPRVTTDTNSDKTTSNVLYLNNEIVQMMQTNPELTGQVLKNIETLGYTAAPLTIENVCDILDATPLNDHPNTLSILRDRQVLGHAGTYLRRKTIENWLKDGIKPQNKHIIKHYKNAARVLFDQNANITADDVKMIKDLYKKHRRQRFLKTPATQDVFFTIAKTLEQTTFFDHKLFQEKDMSFFKKVSPEILKKFFNSKATEKRNRTYGENGFPRRTRLSAVEDFVEQSTPSMSAAHTKKVLDYLFGTTKGRILSPRLSAIIDNMVEKNADFSTIDAMEYVTRKNTGVAKALLDRDLVTPDHFDIDKIQNGETLMWDQHFGGDAQTEFVCQVWLEQEDLKKYKPLRHDKDVLYTQALMKSPNFKAKPPKSFFGRGI